MKFHPESLSETNDGENAVWTQLQAAFRSSPGDAFYRLPIIGNDGHFLYEPDILILVPGYTPLVIECKGCRIDDIESIHGAVWAMGTHWHRRQERPLNQARDQALALRQMLEEKGVKPLTVHSLVALPFIGRDEWMQRFEGRNVTEGILFADDICLAERFVERITVAMAPCRLGSEGMRRLAQAVGASDRWSAKAVVRRTSDAPRSGHVVLPTPTPPTTVVPGKVEGPVVTFLRYAGLPPTAQQICEATGIADGVPYTYLVATTALEWQRREDGLGGQHQLKKNLRDGATEPEEMQLLFHKAMRHFVARPVLSRTEERVIIQRTIREVAQGDQVVADQLRRDVFAWRDILGELEEEGLDLRADGVDDAQWAHPALKAIATALQNSYRKNRREAGRAKSTFEEAARHYLQRGYVPTSVIVMEGFTRLTPLQQQFIRHCTACTGIRLWIVLPYNVDQRSGFAALDRTYQPFAVHAGEVTLLTEGPPQQTSLGHLQTGLFSRRAAPQMFQDRAVSLHAFPHRNDEVAFCVREVIRMLHGEQGRREAAMAADIAVVCSDPQAISPLLREEAELQGRPDLFALPPRQLLLTPVGRFILVLYEVWKSGRLDIEAEQFATLLASGWLGAHAQHSAELFVALSRQHFTFCRTEVEWRSAFDRINRQRERGNTVLGSLYQRLPVSLVKTEDVDVWRRALDTVIQLCTRIFRLGERTIGEHIRLLLDEVEQLDPRGMLRTEREVLADIRAALDEIADGNSVAIDANEFGEVLSGLIRERKEDGDGELPGIAHGSRLQQVWVVGPEGIDNISCRTVFFLGVDESRMPAPGTPPWPRIVWSAQEHIERQRYRFLAVIRAARETLHLSFSRQDWEKQYQPSPYLEEAARLLRREIVPDGPSTAPPTAQQAPTLAQRARIRREDYAISELAIYRLCPYRFKMEALSSWAACYIDSWQLEWLARGLWLAEAFYHVATESPGQHPAEAFRTLLETAVSTVRGRIIEHMPGLRPLAWTTIERQVRGNVAFVLRPTGSQQLPLVGMAVPEHRGKTHDLPIGGDRKVVVRAEADFQEIRGPYLNFIRDTNQSALWLVFGRNDQAIGDASEHEEHLFKRLYDAVRWWRDLTFHMTRQPSSLPPQKANELLDSVLRLEEGNFRKNPGDHCRYCPVMETCMGLRP